MVDQPTDGGFATVTAALLSISVPVPPDDLGVGKEDAFAIVTDALATLAGGVVSGGLGSALPSRLLERDQLERVVLTEELWVLAGQAQAEVEEPLGEVAA